MTDKSFEDMTASELLRWAAINENDCHANSTAHARLFSAVEGRDYYRTTDDEDREALRALADKIDAEISDACRQAVRESKKPIWWFKSAIARGEDWPEPRDDEKFRDYLSRCFIPRPRFDDGEPVQWCDRGIEWQDDMFAYFNAVNQSGVPLAVGAHEVIAGAKMTEDGRVKRASCKALGADGLPIVYGETVFLVPGAYSDGLPTDCGELVVVDTGTLRPVVTVRNEQSDKCNLYRVEASSLTHCECDVLKRPVPEVSLGDGHPVSKGETVYVIESGIERTVKDFGTKLCEGMDGWDGSPWVMFDNGSWTHARNLTHTPPDTQEIVDKDARMNSTDYWGCDGVLCADCPAEIDGRKPWERYGVYSCESAMRLDLLRRQRELDARNGGAE